jgi:hypothetical protein
MQKILKKLTKKDEEPSASEMREMILRLERDEAMDADAAETALWAQKKEKADRKNGFLSAHMPPVKRKRQASTNKSASAS